MSWHYSPSEHRDANGKWTAGAAAAGAKVLREGSAAHSEFMAHGNNAEIGGHLHAAQAAIKAGDEAAAKDHLTHALNAAPGKEATALRATISSKRSKLGQNKSIQKGHAAQIAEQLAPPVDTKMSVPATMEVSAQTHKVVAANKLTNDAYAASDKAVTAQAHKEAAQAHAKAASVRPAGSIARTEHQKMAQQHMAAAAVATQHATGTHGAGHQPGKSGFAEPAAGKEAQSTAAFKQAAAAVTPAQHRAAADAHTAAAMAHPPGSEERSHHLASARAQRNMATGGPADSHGKPVLTPAQQKSHAAMRAPASPPKPPASVTGATPAKMTQAQLLAPGATPSPDTVSAHLKAASAAAGKGRPDTAMLHLDIAGRHAEKSGAPQSVKDAIAAQAAHTKPFAQAKYASDAAAKNNTGVTPTGHAEQIAAQIAGARDASKVYRSIENAKTAHISGIEKDAIANYANSSSVAVNMHLRKGVGAGTEYAAGETRMLDYAFQHAKPLAEPIVVHRGIAGGADAPDVLGPVGSKVGKTIHDKAFTSTTADASIAKDSFSAQDPGSAIMHITVPAGAKVIKPGSLAYRKEEKELILDRGVNLHITRDEVNASGERHVHATASYGSPAATVAAPTGKTEAGHAEQIAMQIAGLEPGGGHPADRMTTALSPKAEAAKMTDAELAQADAELGRRAALTGHAGQLSKAHKAVRDEQAKRKGGSIPIKVTGPHDKKMGNITMQVHHVHVGGEHVADVHNHTVTVGQKPISPGSKVVYGGHQKTVYGYSIHGQKAKDALVGVHDRAAQLFPGSVGKDNTFATPGAAGKAAAKKYLEITRPKA